MTLDGMVKRDEKIQKDFDATVAKVTLAVNQMKMQPEDMEEIIQYVNLFFLDRIEI